MKFLSLNFMSGGFADYKSDEVYPQRLDSLIKELKAVKPDYVTIADSFRWKELFSLQDLRELFGFSHAYCINLEDEKLLKKNFDTGITVLTNETVEFQTIRIFNRNAIKSTLTHNRKTLEVFSIYLDYEEEETRLWQIKSVLKLINKKQPTIITGDLNTMDIEDVPAAEQGIVEAVLALPMFDEVEKQINEMKKGLVIAELKSEGFADGGKTAGFTAPTPLSSFFLLRPVIRIDYLFANKKVKVSDFEVLKNNGWGKISDHYPIAAEVEIANK